MAQYDEERSPLWSIGAVGALSAGAYAGMKGSWKDLLSAAAGERANHLAVIEKLVSEVPKFAEPKYTFDFLSAVKGLETSPAMQEPFKEDIAANAYEAIMRGKKAVGHKDAHGIFESIRSAPSVDKAYEMAQREISNMGGDSALFAKRMSEVFDEGVYNVDRANRIASSSAVYEGAIFSSAEARAAISKNDLSKTAINTASEVEQRLRGIFADKGIGYSAPEYFSVDGQEMMRVTVGDPGRKPAVLDFPLRPDVKEMYVGRGLHSRYLTREAWDLLANGEIQKKNFLQFYLDTLQTEANKAKGAAGMKRAIRNTIETVQQKAMQWAPPKEFLSSGMAAKEALVTSQAVFMGDRPDPSVIEAAITRGGMFPVGGAKQVASGTLSTVDWRKKLFGSMDELMPYERNPLQFLRDWSLAEHSASEQGGKYAADLMKDRFSPIVAGPETEAALAGHKAPRINTLYMKNLVADAERLKIDPQEHLKSLGVKDYHKYIAEEMGILSRRGAALQQWERVQTEKVRLAKGFRIHEAVKAHMEANAPAIGAPQLFEKPVQLTEGALLGMGESGSYLTIGRDRGLRRDLLGYTVTDNGEIKLALKEIKHLGQGDVGKFFSLGSSVKHTLTAGDPEAFMREVLGNKARSSDVDVVLPGERLSFNKNPYAIAAQQMEAMEFFSNRRIGSLQEKIAKAKAAGDLKQAAKYERSISNLRSYAEDPLKYAGLSDDFFNLARAKAPKDIETLAMMTQNRLAVTAEKLGFKGQTLSEIFGLSDIDIPSMVAKAEDLGEETLSTGAANRLQTAINKSVAVRGTPMMFMGDLVTDLGAGNMARFESSMFQWISKTGPGDLGARLLLDVESRVRPDLATSSRAAIEDLTKMQRSLLGEGDGLIDRALGGFPEAESFGAISRGNMLRETGYWADLGQGIEALGGNRRIYIPGTGAVSAIGPSVSNKGEVLASEFENALYDLQYALGDKSENSAKKIGEAAKNLQSLGQAQWASSVSIRDRALGTRYMPSQRLPMTELSEGAEALSDRLASRTHKITKRTAGKMFEEMFAAAPDTATQEFIKGQQVAFEAGERIPGLVGRYPAVGPYSIQPTFFQLIDELQTPGMRNRALNNVIYAPEAMDKLAVSGLDKAVSKSVQVGQGVGQRLDWDLDFQVMSLLSNEKTAQDTTKYLVEGAGEDYTQYLGRHYMLKELFDQQAKKIKPVLERGEAEKIAGAARHSAGQAMIGRTNVALEKFRRSVAMEGTAAQQIYEPLLWHMEETATIMAKHGGAGAATKMANLYEGAISNIEAGNVDVGGKMMQEALETLGGKESRTMQASFASTGATIDYVFDPAKQGRQLAEMYGQNKAEVAYAMSISKAAKASFVNDSMENMRAMLAAQDSRVFSDAAQATVSARAFGEAGFAQKAQRLGSFARNRGSAIANVLKRGKGPMLLGAAAAAGIMLMSPATSGSVTTNVNQDGPAGGRNLRPEDSIPPGGSGITPPPSGMMVSPSTYHNVGNSTRVNMSGSSKDFSGRNYEETMMQLRSLRGAQMKTRLNVSDSRSALDPNMLADRIYRGM